MTPLALGGLLLTGALAGASVASAAEGGRWAISVNDGHSTTLPDGKMATAATYAPDTAVLIGFRGDTPFIGSGVAVPTSVQGPPTMVWISPRSRWALVTSGSKAGDAPGAPLRPDDRVSVLRIVKGVPEVVQTVTAGLAPSGVAVSADQRWALVANRVGGTVSVFRVADRRLTLRGTIDFGKDSGPTTLEFLPNGQDALVVLRKRNVVQVLHRQKDGYHADPTPVAVGPSPNTMDINASSGLIAVGGMDKTAPNVTILRAEGHTVRQLYQFPVAIAPEPLHFAPGGKVLAVGSVNGSNVHPDRHGTVALYTIGEKGATKRAEAPAGTWPQGIIFSPDGRRMLVQNTTDKTLGVYTVGQASLTLDRTLPLGAGPAAMASPW